MTDFPSEFELLNPTIVNNQLLAEFCCLVSSIAMQQPKQLQEDHRDGCRES